MWKLTCFAAIEPNNLTHVLKSVHFRPVKSGLEWYMDDITFRIEPFDNQPRDSMKAYRIFYNGDINGLCYLFDLSLGCMGAMVTGIEYVIEHSSMKGQDWLKDLRKRPSFQLIDVRGLFIKNGVNVVLVNDALTLQIRARKDKKLILVDCLKKVDFIREELVPVEYDLFSIQEEEIA